ncbi:MAG: hypothetical protein R2716_13230 [Microthrixaceae bacterium]
MLTSSRDKAGTELDDWLATGAQAPAGLTLTEGSDPAAFLEAGCDAVVYASSGDVRPGEATAEILAALRSGLCVVTPSVYALYDPLSAPPDLLRAAREATESGSSALFVSGVDPGWGNDVLPLLATGLCSGIRSVRCIEVFDYSTYDQEFSVRELVGMGMPMDRTPPMVAPGVPTMVWGGQVRMLARALGLDLDGIEESVERVPLESEVSTRLGSFAAGTQGALRFEVAGRVGASSPIVVEHVTRIDPRCAPDWAQPTTGEGSHRVVVEGTPRLEITVEAEAEGGNRAAGGNATAAMRLVGALPWLLEAEPGVYDATQVPILPGRGRFVL